jgi:hypothetical protein
MHRLTMMVCALLAPCVSQAQENADLSSGTDILEEHVNFMSGFQTLQFESLVTYNVLQDSGQKISFDMQHHIRIRKPDRLFWTTLYDDAVTDSVWFSNGEFTLLKQPANVWARITAPPTISDAVDRLVDEYGIPVPFADLLTSEPQEFWLGKEILSVEYVGEAYIDGLWTDHLAIRKPGVDMEYWIRQGEEPFPVRLSFQLLDEPGQPSHAARLFDWSTSVTTEELPQFRPPVGSEQIEMVPVSSSREGSNE